MPVQCATIRRRPVRLAGLAALWSLLAFSPAAFAGSDCAELLQDAEAQFRIGLLEKARDSLGTCLAGRPSRADRARAYELLAKIHLAVDRDDLAREAVAGLLDAQPDFSPRPAVDSRPFVELVTAERRERSATLVATVSKTPEDLRLAPATVAVVTGEEIRRRGYLDLEALLHDLPGFDISRGNGEVYSSIYMRGYRSARNDRMLLLVDGVEQNDVHSNAAYLSRQYPLTGVERVEVVYGPASTMYGANAYTGVIHVITEDPASRVRQGEKHGFEVQATGGSFDTRSLDFTVAGVTVGELRWSLTGRSYRSDEMDLSGFPDWDYDVEASLPAADAYEAIMRLEGDRARELVDGFGLRFSCRDLCKVSPDGTIVELTDTGAAEARRLDEELFDLLHGEPIGFSDQTDDWYLYGKLQVSNHFKLGLQAWRREEGTAPWFADLLRTGRDAGSVWVPRQTSFHAHYSRPIGRALKLSFFSRYKEHTLGGGSSVSRFGTYANGFLNVVELVAFGDPTRAFYQRISLEQSSSQLRNELTLLYEPSQRIQLVGGIEKRDSSVQADYVSSIVSTQPNEGFVFFPEKENKETLESQDLGVFLQASFRPRADLKVVAGARFDDNEVGSNQRVTDAAKSDTELETEGFGTVFTPRLALIYSPGPFVFKAIYSEAFKEPTSFQKYTREPGVREFSSADPKEEEADPDEEKVGLDEEKVRNFELGGSWQPRDDLALEVAAYESTYTEVVALVEDFDAGFFPNVSGQFKNQGGLRIRGLQASFSWRPEPVELFGNYTYTDPVSTDPREELGDPLPGVDEVRIGDIARHRLNLGLGYRFREHFDLSLRANYVGSRRTGEGTTVSSNPLPEVEAYLVANAALSYRNEKALRRGTLQLIVHNLLDEAYDHPGVERAGQGFAARIPQPGRAVFLRGIYRF